MQTEATATELVEMARAGSEEAWGALVHRYSSLVLSRARRYRLSPSDVEDVYQFVWIKLVEHLDDIREPERLAGWIAITAERESLRVVRRAAVSKLDRPEPNHSVEDEVIDTAVLAAVLDGLDAISEKCRKLLRLVFLERLPYVAISDQLGMPVGSIGPRRQRCIGELRTQVNDWIRSE